VATGNWGCGAFLGNPQLKAMVQWATSSEAERTIRFYPFGEQFGPQLALLSEALSAQGATVGDLLLVVDQLRMRSDLTHANIFAIVKAAVIKKIQARSAESSPESVLDTKGECCRLAQSEAESTSVARDLTQLSPSPTIKVHTMPGHISPKESSSEAQEGSSVAHVLMHLSPPPMIKAY